MYVYIDALVFMFSPKRILKLGGGNKLYMKLTFLCPFVELNASLIFSCGVISWEPKDTESSPFLGCCFKIKTEALLAPLCCLNRL